MKLFVDLALRDTGIAIFDDKNLVFYQSLKYKNEFDLSNYLDIIKHYEYIRAEIKSIINNYKIKEVVIEADNFGIRKGGYKTKELLTLVRANLIHAIYNNDKSIKITFIRAYEWKNTLLGTSSKKKDEYKEFAQELINKNFGQSIRNHNIIDAILIGFYIQHIKSS